ncbi:MAG: CoA-binding protein [Chloroflexi bacterium]|nr:CoA-binding protein [Chloroflexota bacterium]
MNDTQMRELFKQSKTIAVVGFSTKEDRPGFYVPQYLQQLGYKIIPVNPALKEGLGEKAYPDLLSIPRETKIDLVEIFRPPEFVPEIVEQAIEIGAKYVWMQIGATNRDAAKAARAAGLGVVEEACMLVEYQRLFG